MNPLTASQVSAVAARFSLTEAEVNAAYNTSGDDPEVKKWKDAFVQAVALWLNCEAARTGTPVGEA